MQSGSSSSSSVFAHTAKFNSYLVFLVGHKVSEITAKVLCGTTSIQYASGEENGPGCGWELR